MTRDFNYTNSSTITKEQSTMDSSAFHDFPQLPTELRLQIWEAACCHVLTTHTYSGVRYIEVRKGHAVVLTSGCWSQTPGQSNSVRRNRSAYLSDSGLWKACKKPKEIIAKHTKFCRRVKINERGVDILWKGTLYDLMTDLQKP